MVEAEQALCVALHDVAPATWPACRRLLALLDEVGPVPVSLLVVPDYHRRGRADDDPDFIRAMEQRLTRGDEIVLHGYHHLDERAAPSPMQWLKRRLYTTEGEFAALSESEAHERLLLGRQMLIEKLGWPVEGFVAPAWLLSAGARRALTHLPFRYTTTLDAIHPLPDWHAMPAPSLVYSVRSPWRRSLSRQWNHWLSRYARSKPLLRIGLHPADAHYPQVMDDWRTLLRQALAQRRPMTKLAWIESACDVALGRC